MPPNWTVQPSSYVWETQHSNIIHLGEESRVVDTGYIMDLPHIILGYRLCSKVEQHFPFFRMIHYKADTQYQREEQCLKFWVEGHVHILL